MKIIYPIHFLLAFTHYFGLVFSSEATYYVTKVGCFGENELCEGSSEYPFGDLITAFSAIEKKKFTEAIQIIIYIQDQASSCLSYPSDTSLKFFWDWSFLNISIKGMNSEKAVVKFCNRTSISLLARGGSLVFENIYFEGIVDTSNLNIPSASSDYSGFIILRPESKTILNLINCEFFGAFVNPSTKAIYSSLIAFSQNFYSFFLIEIYLENIIFRNGRYPLGIINLKSPFNTNKSCKIEIVNSELINYNTGKDFMHWFGGYRMKNVGDEYFDFAFILNNTKLIMRNFSVFNSSRVILANKNNDLLITNFTITLPNDLTRESKNPPEFIYLITLNNIRLTGLSVIDSTIYSFDDTVEPIKRDLALVNASYVPTSLLNFEKNQALFAFGSYNTGELTEIVFMNTTIYKRENFGLSIFGVEFKNKILIKSFLVDLIILDAQSRFGFLAVLYLGASNEASMRVGTILDLNIYGYSNILFAFFNSGNKFNTSSLIFLRIYLKTKSNRAEVMAFMYSFRNSPGVVFFSKSEDIKTGGIFFALVGNSIEIKDIDANDVICLIGCLVTLFYKNSLIINDSVLKFATSEVIASSLSIAFGNFMRAKFLTIESCQGSTGAVYLYRANNATFENSQFNSNLGTGGFPYFKFLEVSGNFALVYDNRMVLLTSSIVLGKSYTLGGAFMLASQNIIQISDTILMSNEAQNGGAILSKSLNNMTIINSKFINNYGTVGSTVYGEESNTFIFKNCSFNLNQAEIAAVIFLNMSNFISIDRAYFTKNQGFVQGGLIIIDGFNQKINLTNITFLNNQAPFKGFLLELNKNNLLLLYNCVIDYGEIGNGNFLYLNTANNLTANNLFIKNINNMNVFIKCSERNTLKLSQTVIENNQWLDSFLQSENNNLFDIYNTTISNVTIFSGSFGFVQANLNTTIILKKSFFNIITSRGCIILEAEVGNVIFIADMILVNIKLIETGVGLNLVDANRLDISGILFQDFYGFSNNIFLFKIFHRNFLNILKMNVTGYSSIEQVWNFTCMIRILANNNSIIFKEAWTSSDNPDFFKVETLVYLKDEGHSNLVSFLNSTITLSNYLSFMEVDTKGTIVIEETHFRNCKIYGDLIILKSSSNLNCRGVNFFSNNLKVNMTLIRILDSVSTKLIKVHQNTNSLFINSKNSSITIRKSTFNRLKRTTGQATCLFIIEDNSDILLDYVYILLRENTDNSIICASSSILKVKNCLLAFNKALLGGVIKISNLSEIYLFQNKFIGNEALLGGVLNFENVSKVTVENNYFYSNKALKKQNLNNTPGKGGCIFASMVENQAEPYFEIKNNKFINNGGEIGGIIYLDGGKSSAYFVQMHFFDQNYLTRTKVRFYGTYAASPPIDLKLTLGSEINSEPLDNINIDEEIPFNIQLKSCLFQIISLDYFNQQAMGEIDFSDLKITMNEGYSIDMPLFNTFPCFKSLIPISSTSLNSLAKTDIAFNLTSTQLSKQVSPDKEKILQIKLRIRKCQRGQFFDLKNLQCVDCQPNFFSFEADYIEPSSCRSCLSEPFNCYGGFNHTPKAGYWRRSQSTTNFMQCPYPPACLGDPILVLEDNQLTVLNEDFDYAYTLGICAIGHSGILCSKCQPGYGKISGERCSLCNGGLNIFLIILKIMVRIFLYYYTIYKAVMLCRKVKNNSLPLDLVYSNFLLKILIIHFQFLKSFLGFPLSFPTVVKEVFNIFTISLSSGADKVINLECFFNFESIPVLYFNTLINIIAPLIVVTTLGIILDESRAEMFIIKKERIDFRDKMKVYLSKFKKKFTKKSFLSLPYLFLVAIMLTYDESLNLLIQNFSFINILDYDDPEYRLVNNLEIDFESTQHCFWLLLFVSPATLFFTFFLPGFILVSIYLAKKHGRLNSEDNLLRFGYFFFAYNDQNEYYEIVYISRKVFLIAMDSFFIRALSITKRYDATAFSIIICFFYFWLAIITFRNSPYKQNIYPILNRMEIFSVTVQAMTSWIGTFLLSLDSESTTFSFGVVNLLGFFVGISLNVTMFMIWGGYFWKLSMSKRFMDFVTIFRTKMVCKYKKKKKVKKPLQTTENKIIEEETMYISTEGKQKIFFPPHFSHRWAVRGSSKGGSGTFKETTPFYLINENCDTSRKQQRMMALWDNFENPERIKAMTHISAESKSIQKFDLVAFSKHIIKTQKSSNLLQIEISLKYDSPCAADIMFHTYTKKGKPFNVFVSKYENNVSERTIELVLILNIADLKQICFVNQFNILLFNKITEINILMIELDIYFFEFLIKLDITQNVINQIYSDLLNSGKHYSSDSQILLLFLPSANLSFQIIKSNEHKGNQTLEFYFLRLINIDLDNDTGIELTNFMERILAI